MTQFSTVYSASPINNIIILFDFQYSSFNVHTLSLLKEKNIQPFEMNSFKHNNNQPNDNGTNAKLKSLYNGVKAYCILKYWTFILPHHKQYILV